MYCTKEKNFTFLPLCSLCPLWLRRNPEGTAGLGEFPVPDHDLAAASAEMGG